MILNQTLFSIEEASEFLACNMNDTIKKSSWSKYLQETVNGGSKKYGGYRISCQIVNGQPFFKETSLKAFVKLIGSGQDRTKATYITRSVDKKSKLNQKRLRKITPVMVNKKK